VSNDEHFKNALPTFTPRLTKRLTKNSGSFLRPYLKGAYQKNTFSQFFHSLLILAHKPLFITYHLCKKQFYAHFKPLPETQVYVVP
jgi:hypothetical protein